MVYAIAASDTIDFSISIVILNVPLMGNIFTDNIKDLNEMVKEVRPHPVLIKAKLRNFLLLYQGTRKYVVLCLKVWK